MDKKSYELINNLEDWHWWHVARKNIILDVLTNNVENYRDKKLLDIGCGSGYFLDSISKYVANAIGIDEHNYENQKFDDIIKVDIFNNGLKNNSFDIITSLDVLEHIENERKFLNEIKRLYNISGGGYILITVPAYQWLFSYHDQINNHYRRYNKSQLKKLLINNGFEIKKISYFNFFLFPIFCSVRIIQKIFNIKSVEKNNKSIFNGILYKIFNVEKYLLRKINLPYGSSLLVLCRPKP